MEPCQKREIFLWIKRGKSRKRGRKEWCRLSGIVPKTGESKTRRGYCAKNGGKAEEGVDSSALLCWEEEEGDFSFFVPKEGVITFLFSLDCHGRESGGKRLPWNPWGCM